MAAWGANAAELPKAAEVLKETGVSAGLAVVVGTTDGALEADLTNNGKMLVRGPALSAEAAAKARKHIFDKRLYGLASVSEVGSVEQLPYYDRLVNLLVADLDALGKGAPSKAEIDRVLGYEGVAYTRREGKWTKTVLKTPPEIDSWTHYHYDASCNAVSQDRVVGSPNTYRWIDGLPHGKGLRLMSAQVGSTIWENATGNMIGYHIIGDRIFLGAGGTPVFGGVLMRATGQRDPTPRNGGTNQSACDAPSATVRWFMGKRNFVPVERKEGWPDWVAIRCFGKKCGEKAACSYGSVFGLASFCGCDQFIRGSGACYAVQPVRPVADTSRLAKGQGRSLGQLPAQAEASKGPAATFWERPEGLSTYWWNSNCRGGNDFRCWTACLMSMPRPRPHWTPTPPRARSVEPVLALEFHGQRLSGAAVARAPAAADVEERAGVEVEPGDAEHRGGRVEPRRRQAVHRGGRPAAAGLLDLGQAPEDRSHLLGGRWLKRRLKEVEFAGLGGAGQLVDVQEQLQRFRPSTGVSRAGSRPHCLQLLLHGRIAHKPTAATSADRRPAAASPEPDP